MNARAGIQQDQEIDAMRKPKIGARLPHFAEKLGIAFRDPALFQRALTHRSYLNEHPDEDLQDNQRLEFLGDAVLDFVAAEWLYERLPEMGEGALTRLRAGLVRNDTLATYAGALGIGEMLLMGRGEEDGGGRSRPRNLSCALEAIIGALYLDQGLGAARAFILPWFESALEALLREQSDKDAKSRLQEWSQSRWSQVPSYRAVQITGPEHAPEFTVEVTIDDEVYGVGKGPSKQAAAQAAARAALAALKEKGWLG